MPCFCGQEMCDSHVKSPWASRVWVFGKFDCCNLCRFYRLFSRGNYITDPWTWLWSLWIWREMGSSTGYPQGGKMWWSWMVRCLPKPPFWGQVRLLIYGVCFPSVLLRSIEGSAGSTRWQGKWLTEFLQQGLACVRSRLIRISGPQTEDPQHNYCFMFYHLFSSGCSLFYHYFSFLFIIFFRWSPNFAAGSA